MVTVQTKAPTCKDRESNFHIIILIDALKLTESRMCSYYCIRIGDVTNTWSPLVSGASSMPSQSKAGETKAEVVRAVVLPQQDPPQGNHRPSDPGKSLCSVLLQSTWPPIPLACSAGSLFRQGYPQKQQAHISHGDGTHLQSSALNILLCWWLKYHGMAV